MIDALMIDYTPYIHTRIDNSTEISWHYYVIHCWIVDLTGHFMDLDTDHHEEILNTAVASLSSPVYSLHEGRKCLHFAHYIYQKEDKEKENDETCMYIAYYFMPFILYYS